MNNNYTIAQLARALGCDKNTLGRWLYMEEMIPEQLDRYDMRKKFISRQDAEKLAAIHSRPLAELDDLPATLTECHALILKQRAYILRLQEEKSRKPPTMPLERPPAVSHNEDIQTHRPPRAQGVMSHTRRPALPDGWVSLDGFCKAHDINRSTVDKAIATGRLPQPARGEWQEGRAVIRTGLDPEMQQMILEAYPGKR